MTRGEANMVLGNTFRSCKKFITETPIHQLAIMVGIGAATVQSFGYYVRSKSADNITQKEYFLNAIKLTKNHPAAEYLIGKPIYYKGLDADFLLRQCYCNQYRQGVYNAYFNGSTRADLNKINKYSSFFNMGQTAEYEWGHVNFTKYVRYTFVQLMHMQKNC